ncbi:alpha/beta hydrolase [Pseudactinotalea sp.]|uniref:alpha/beta hydrolase n=1 Tax=Pseudactinotalea sp. TaxID=1926260 RepID=UPI003B39FF65
MREAGAVPSDLNVIAGPRPDHGFVLVLPGGGYLSLSPSEAEPVCDWLASEGFPCGWLRYPVDPARHPAPLATVLDAVLQLRGVVDGPIAVMGFSAGGHLAGLAATATSEDIASLASGAESARPDLAVLGYPVVSVHRRPMGRMGDSLLGPDPDDPASLSLENRVTSQTPPCFVWHTAPDPSVPADESLRLGAALVAAGAEVELHLYPHGGHGLSVTRDATVPRTRRWREDCSSWLAEHGVSTR